jgi:hypothetical protein
MLARSEDGVFALRLADGGVVAVSGQDERAVREVVQSLGDRLDGLLEIAGALGSPGPAWKEDVAREENSSREVAGAARGVTGRVQSPDCTAAYLNLCAIS